VRACFLQARSQHAVLPRGSSNACEHAVRKRLSFQRPKIRAAESTPQVCVMRERRATRRTGRSGPRRALTVEFPAAAPFTPVGVCRTNDAAIKVPTEWLQRIAPAARIPLKSSSRSRLPDYSATTTETRRMPLDHLINMATGVVHSAMLGAAAKARIADQLATSPLSAAEIAQRTGLSPDAVHRLMRALAAMGVFEMDHRGCFANNEASNALRSDSEFPRMRAMAEYFGSPWNLRSWAAFGQALAGGAVPFVQEHRKSMWEWFAEHAEDAACFAQQMEDNTAVSAGIIAARDTFAGVSCLCDVAGGTGVLLSHILARHTPMRGILFDTGATFQDAEAVFARANLRDRVELVAGSFFDFLPPADAYVLKDILHDWDDERSSLILRNVRHAARPNARLVIVEAVLESTEVCRPKAISDLEMMVVNGGRQRSRAQFRQLLDQSGFRLERIEESSSSMFGLVVASAS
jgi:C-methyltransferase